MKTYRKLWTLVITLVVLTCAMTTTAWAADTWNGDIAEGFAVGGGTEGDPYQISTGAELAFLAQQVNLGDSNGGSSYSGEYFILTQDIDLNSQEWTPIGTSSKQFAGTFDGDGYEITDLYIDVNTDATYYYAGLFGYVNGGTVENVSVSGSITVATSNALYVGGVVGHSTGTVTNCTSAVTVTASGGSYAYAGGVVGYSTGTVTNCTNAVAVTASGGSYSRAGGVVGFNTGTVTNCYATGTVTAEDGSSNYAGGVVGHNYGGTVSNCYATGSVTAKDGSTNYAGGVVGYNNGSGTVKNCYWSGTVTAGGSTVTKAVGYGTGTSNCVSFTDDGTSDFSAIVDSVQYDTLLDALNAWVTNTNSAAYRTWTQGDTYPVFGEYWVSTIVLDGGTDIHTISVAGTYAISMAEGLDCTAESIVISSSAGDVTLMFDDVTMATSGNTIKAQSGYTSTLTIQGTLDVSGTGGNAICLDGGTLTISGSGTAITASSTNTTAIYATTEPTLTDVTIKANDGEKYTQAVTWDSTTYNLDSDGSSAKNVRIVGNPIVVSPDGSDPVTVDGLDDVALEQGESVTLTVAETDGTADGADEIADVVTGNTTEYLNITLETTVGDTLIPNPTTVLEICIPYDYTDKRDVVVYRYHDGGVDTFASLSAQATAPYTDGAYFADETSGKLYIYTSKFSTYAVGYNLMTSYASSGGSSSYSTSVASADNGSVSISSGKSTMNTTVTITAIPDDGYQVGTVTVTYSSGREVTVTDNGDGTYSYLQPGAAVTVTVTFAEEDIVVETETDSLFTDVDEDDWYYDAVLWAVDNGITSGYAYGGFEPNGITSRAQAVTFLWRAMGEPAWEMCYPFADVEADAWYTDAVYWARVNGITQGTTEDYFTPDLDCSRAHIITFLWRMMGEPVVDSINPFTDVDADSYYYNAILWAVGAGITEGTTDTTFSPDQDCTRAEIVTFLYRALAD